jgi:hypothetical protein
MDISTREERNKFIESLSKDLWIEWVLLTTEITAFYAQTPPQLDTDESTFFILDLLKADEKHLTIDIFREKFKRHIEQGEGKLRKLLPFPKNYSPQNKCLTKREEAELSFYFAVRACICEFNNDSNKGIFGLSRAIFLRGYALGLSKTKSLSIVSYYEMADFHDLGGQAVANKADLAKQQVIALWGNRFDNPSLKPKHKKFKAQLAQWIVDNPQIITDQKGNTLTKNNGEAWYTDKNTISGILVGQ